MLNLSNPFELQGLISFYFFYVHSNSFVAFFLFKIDFENDPQSI